MFIAFASRSAHRAALSRVWLVILAPLGIASLVPRCEILPSATAEDSAMVVGEAFIEKELKDGELHWFRGEYDDALDCLALARATAAVGLPPGVDPLCTAAGLELWEAEIRFEQGFGQVAQGIVKRAKGKLTTRGTQLARAGLSVADLASINYRLGYADLILGDIQLQRALLTYMRDGDRLPLARCLPHYETGVKTIRTTWAAQAGRNDTATDLKDSFYDPFTDVGRQKIRAIRLVHMADLRYARMLAFAGKPQRALSYYNDVKRYLTEHDLLWLIQFNRDGVTSDMVRTSLDINGGEKIASKNKNYEKSASDIEPGQSPENNDDSQSALLEFESSTREGPVAREARRTARQYIELLLTKAELSLDESDRRVNEAEEAASRARDVAEEKFPNSPIHAEAITYLARVCLAATVDEAELARKNKADVFIFDGEVLNTHEQASKSYLADAAFLASELLEMSADWNPAQPWQLASTLIELNLAKLRKDPNEIRRLEIKVETVTEAMKNDKPKRP